MKTLIIAAAWLVAMSAAAVAQPAALTDTQLDRVAAGTSPDFNFSTTVTSPAPFCPGSSLCGNFSVSTAPATGLPIMIAWPLLAHM